MGLRCLYKIIILWRKKVVDLRRSRFIYLFFLFNIPFPAFAGDFDGSKPLSGSVDKILEINPSRISN